MGFFDRQFGAGMVLREDVTLNAVVADFVRNNINLRPDNPLDGGPAIWVADAAAARIEECMWKNNTPSTQGNVATPSNDMRPEDVYADDSLAAVIDTVTDMKFDPRPLEDIEDPERFLGNATEFFARNSPVAVLEDTESQVPLTPVRAPVPLPRVGHTGFAHCAKHSTACAAATRACARVAGCTLTAVVFRLKL